MEGEETNKNEEKYEGEEEDEEMADAEDDERTQVKEGKEDETTRMGIEDEGSESEEEDEEDNNNEDSGNLNIYNIDERSVRLGEVAWHSLLPIVRDKAERFVTTKPRKGAKKYQCLATMMSKVEKIIDQSEAYENSDLTLDEWRELIKNSVKESGTTIGKVPIKKGARQELTYTD